MACYITKLLQLPSWTPDGSGFSWRGGATDTEIAVVRKRIEEHMAPEIAEARDATLAALLARWKTVSSSM